VLSLIGIWCRRSLAVGALNDTILNPLRFEPVQSVPDGAVLAARVHALQHDQNRALGLRVEAVLQGHHLRNVSQSPSFGLARRF